MNYDEEFINKLDKLESYMFKYLLDEYNFGIVKCEIERFLFRNKSIYYIVLNEHLVWMTDSRLIDGKEKLEHSMIAKGELRYLYHWLADKMTQKVFRQER